MGITNISGINYFLGLTSKHFYKPLKKGALNSYWHWETVILFYANVGVGSDYVFKNGYFIGFKTYYIVPSISIGIYFK